MERDYGPNSDDVPLDDPFERVSAPLNQFADRLAQNEARRMREIHMKHGQHENPLHIGAKEIGVI